MTEIQNNKRKNNRFEPVWNLEFEIWCLKFEIYLEFGTWNLGFN